MNLCYLQILTVVVFGALKVNSNNINSNNIWTASMVTELPNQTSVDLELLSRLQYFRIPADGKVNIFKFSDNYSSLLLFPKFVTNHPCQFVSSGPGCSKLTTLLVNLLTR